MKLQHEISHQLPTSPLIFLLHVHYTTVQVMIVKSDSNWFHDTDWARGEVRVPSTWYGRSICKCYSCLSCSRALGHFPLYEVFMPKF